MDHLECVKEERRLLKDQLNASAALGVAAIVAMCVWRSFDALAFAVGLAYALLTIKLYGSIARLVLHPSQTLLEGSAAALLKIPLFVAFGFFLAARGMTGALTAIVGFTLALCAGGLLYSTRGAPRV